MEPSKGPPTDLQLAADRRPSSLKGLPMLQPAQTPQIDVCLVAELPPSPQAPADAFRAFLKKKIHLLLCPFPQPQTLHHPRFQIFSLEIIHTLKRGDQ